MSLLEHLQTGATTVCRCWRLVRRDGFSVGFTDHDRNLSFAGMTFRADSGMTAHAFQQGTGLSVDNSEAIGVLTGDGVRETDVEAGRLDGATVTAWLVNWTNPAERRIQFTGTLGEITRSGGAFRVELRGMTEALNQPQGRIYQRQCSAVLGDRNCRVDLSNGRWSRDVPVEHVEAGRAFSFTSLQDFDARWFERGRLSVLSGEAKGLVGIIKNDRHGESGRGLELWQALRLPIARGDMVRVEAGCDKRDETCKAKFDNFLNFRGFPHIPGEDWLLAYPNDRKPNDGGSLT
ncbi:DUF2163 domain-containing protein [Roseitranquillus sediminis]|uniref:DUF2163 domain-containing protein n=1 Tax=Roseitranquillus sediminis TaxID=2809051 RepID=UPI001D0BF5CF|nr:DUF2163 domain-containing protein [Roseitranquillus sediminis]MBM9595203.1 DUF2163 domain-containing protein [Roseitranquillus sediminis]